MSRKVQAIIFVNIIKKEKYEEKLLKIYEKVFFSVFSNQREFSIETLARLLCNR
jgi:hypothetical protein